MRHVLSYRYIYIPPYYRIAGNFRAKSLLTIGIDPPKPYVLVPIPLQPFFLHPLPVIIPIHFLVGRRITSLRASYFHHHRLERVSVVVVPSALRARGVYIPARGGVGEGQSGRRRTGYYSGAHSTTTKKTTTTTTILSSLMPAKRGVVFLGCAGARARALERKESG